MDTAKICGFGIMCAMICVIIKHYRNEFSIPVKLGSIIGLFAVIITMLSPLFTYFKNIAGDRIPSEYTTIILKALGIGYITQVSSDLCRDCGESSIAFGIESVGKTEIIILALPLISKIIELSEELMQW